MFRMSGRRCSLSQQLDAPGLMQEFLWTECNKNNISITFSKNQWSEVDANYIWMPERGCTI